MKTLLLLLVLPAMLSAQYTGGSGRGDASLTITGSVLSALPVELTAFTASIEKNLVSLKWNTATEVNNTRQNHCYYSVDFFCRRVEYLRRYARVQD